jgi:hypothetical protein
LDPKHWRYRDFQSFKDDGMDGGNAQLAAIPRGLAKPVEGSQPPYRHWFGVIWRRTSA